MQLSTQQGHKASILGLAASHGMDATCIATRATPQCDRKTYHRASAAGWGSRALTSTDLPDEIRK